MADYIPYILSFFVGVGLAAASGFRVFLPLFFISLGTYLGWIPEHSSYAWVGGLPAVIATGLATLIEILAYYIPFIDNLLDTIAVPLATVAGSLLVAAQFTELNAWTQWSLAIISGGGTAAAISSAFAGTRAASSSTTAGLGNSVVSSVETIGATLMSILAVFLPILGIIVVLLLLFLVFRFGKRLVNKLRRKPQALH